MKNQVVISVFGGVVQDVFAPAGVDVILIDWDAMSGESDVVEVDGEPAYTVRYPAAPIELLEGTDCEAAMKKAGLTAT